MNILIMPSWYASNREPNSGCFFADQAKALMEQGNDVTIAVVDIINYPYKSENKFYKIFREKRYNMDVYRIEVPSLFTGHFPKLFFSYYTFFYKRLFKYLLNLGLTFDLIHAHSFWPAGYAGVVLKKIYNLPLVITEHRSIIISNEYPQSADAFLKKCVDSSNTFIAVSNNLKNVIEEKTGYINKIHVIPNMVDSIFTYKKLENSSTFDFITIGNLIESKRIFDLIKKFIEIFKDNRNVKLIVIGDGPLREKIREYLENKDINRQVEVLGLCSKEIVVDSLAKSRVFVLPSIIETFGIVYAEAISVGRPVIATHNGGADFIINDDNGILVDIDDFDALGEAMRHMIIDYSKYDLMKISELSLAKYSKNAIIDEIVLLYRTLM